MKVSLLPALITPLVLLASPMPAGAAGAPTVNTTALPIAACAFGSSFGDSCALGKPYVAGGQAGNGRFSPKGFFVSPEQAGLVRHFDESFADPRRLMQRCLGQKPSFAWPQRNAAAWQWKQSHQEYPLPADPNAEIVLSSSQRSLADYQSCMLQR